MTDAEANDRKEANEAVLKQVNALLLESGFIERPLDVGTIEAKQVKRLSDVLHALLAQRQRDADLRIDLASKNRVLESTVERTKKFWQEDEEKRADAERRLEAAKGSASSTSQQLDLANASLRKLREELHKTRKDLLTVKQQATLQKVANERQIERLKARFTEEAVKSLRTQSQHVQLATLSAFSSASTTARDGRSAPSSSEMAIARRQIDELERQRSNIVQYNDSLKRMATDTLNLALQASTHLANVVAETDAASGNASRSTSRPISAQYTQRDLFPSHKPLLNDDVAQLAASSRSSSMTKEHPAIQSFVNIAERIDEQVRLLREGQSDRTWKRTQEARKRLRESIVRGDEGESGMGKEVDSEERERERMLEDALDHVSHLEKQLRVQHEQVEALQRRDVVRSASLHDRDAAQQDQATTEMERQRQRYLSLCRALEEEEAELRREREALAREREQVALDHSLLSATAEGDLSTKTVQPSSEVADESQASTIATVTSVTRPSSGLAHRQLASTPRTNAPPLVSQATTKHMQTQRTGIPPVPFKRTRADERPNDEEEKENAQTQSVQTGKRPRTESAKSGSSEKTGTQVIGGNEMRFITMRKRRELPR